MQLQEKELKLRGISGVRFFSLVSFLLLFRGALDARSGKNAGGHPPQTKENLSAMMRRDELFGWSGPTVSGSGNGPATQILFLIDEMLVFDGWDIIEREDGPGSSARSGRPR